MVTDARPRVGVSACLLGERVRYDGGHKQNAIVTDLLGAHVDWLPVCPEVEVGMSTPREPLRLVREGGRIRMVTVGTRVDYSDAMEVWAARRLHELAAERLSGYVLKRNSPSCGLDGVTLFGRDGTESGEGSGLFAAALMRRFPDLPVEDELGLADALIRTRFLARVFGYWREHYP